MFADFTYDSQFILAENQHYFVLFSILHDSSIYVYYIENKKVKLNTIGSDIYVNLALGSDSNDIIIRKSKKIIYKKNDRSLPKLKSTKKDREAVDASPKGKWLFEISKNGKVFLSSQPNSKSFLLKVTQEEFTDPMICLVYDFDKNENQFIYIGNDGNLYNINLLNDKIYQCDSVNAASIIYDNYKDILYYFHKGNYVNNSLVKFDLNNCIPHNSIKSSTLLVKPIGYNDTMKSIFFLDKQNQFSNYFPINMKTIAFSLEKHDAQYNKNQQMGHLHTVSLNI